MKKENVAVILVCPENPDNIGAVARAVMNMGFCDLRLVSPPKKWREKAKKMAMSALPVLKKAKAFPTLKKAMKDLATVLGTSRRSGGFRGQFRSFGKGLGEVARQSEKQKVGIAFGRESKGLSNEESALCNYLITIPSSEEYPSLNLAQAVMVMLFTLVRETFEESKKEDKVFITKKETEKVLKYFKDTLKHLGYKTGGADLLPRIIKTFKGLINRSGLLKAESQMLMGLTRKIKEKTKKGK